MSAFTRGGVALTAVAVIAGVAGCTSDDGKKDDGAAKPAASKKADANPAEVLTAAYKKTSGAKSAKISMKMTTPAAAAQGAGKTETVTMSGVMGWDPTAMDMTVDGSALGAEAGAPEKVRMLMLKDVTYVDMGAAAAKQEEFDGKRWMKLDVGKLSKSAGNPASSIGTLGGLKNANQDPSQQLAMLVDSPSIKHVGPEKVDGVQAEHYRGSLTFQEMLDTNSAADTLTPKQRKDLVAAMKTAGMKTYNTDVWVNADGYPVRLDVVMDMKQGKTSISEHFSDYGTPVTATPPAAADTFDLMKMINDMAADSGA